MPTSAKVRGARGRKDRKQKQFDSKTTVATTIAPPLAIARKEEEVDDGPDKPYVPFAADPLEVEAIKKRMLEVVTQANRWIFHNIARHSERDTVKAKRLTERFNELPERYMKDWSNIIDCHILLRIVTYCNILSRIVTYC